MKNRRVLITVALLVLATPLSPAHAGTVEQRLHGISERTSDTSAAIEDELSGRLQRTAPYVDAPAPPGVIDNPDVSVAAVPTATLNELLATTGNPYGCYGTTGHPHYSTGDASVHGSTRCRVNVGYLSAANTLYRARWYGPEQLDTSRSYRNYSYTSQDAVSRWYCRGTGEYTYEGVTYHEATDGANTYTVTTRNSNRFRC